MNINILGLFYGVFLGLFYAIPTIVFSLASMSSIFRGIHFSLYMVINYPMSFLYGNFWWSKKADLFVASVVGFAFCFFYGYFLTDEFIKITKNKFFVLILIILSLIVLSLAMSGVGYIMHYKFMFLWKKPQ